MSRGRGRVPRWPESNGELRLVGASHDGEALLTGGAITVSKPFLFLVFILKCHPPACVPTVVNRSFVGGVKSTLCFVLHAASGMTHHVTSPHDVSRCLHHVCASTANTRLYLPTYPSVSSAIGHPAGRVRVPPLSRSQRDVQHALCRSRKGRWFSASPPVHTHAPPPPPVRSFAYHTLSIVSEIVDRPCCKVVGPHAYHGVGKH